MYGAESWTLTKKLERKINGCYTRLLRMVLNVHWSQHLTNVELYGNIPIVSDKIKERRLKLAGHCVRHTEEMASKLILWEPVHGRSRRGRPPISYIDTLKKDTELDSVTEIRTAMMDRNTWRGYVKSGRVGTRRK